MFHFSTWLRKSYPGLFRTSKKIARKKQHRAFRLERLEDRVTPSLTLNSSHAGLNFNDGGGYIPPDPNGAAGSGNTYVQTANQVIGLFSKADGSRIATDSFGDFWYTQGGLAKTGSFSFLSHPIVVFDDQIDRFIVGDQDVSTSATTSNFDLAVSKSADPATLTTADWTFVQVNTTESGFSADYIVTPGNFGYNHDVFAFTLNMYSGNTLDHVQVNALDITSLIGGTVVDNHQDIAGAASLRPTVMHDSVAGDPMWLVGDNGDGQNIDVYRMDNPDSSSTTSFTEFKLAVNPFTEIGNGLGYPNQPDGSVITSNIDSRIMKSAEMNNTLVASQAVTTATGDRDYARWYQIDVSDPANPTIIQQGNYTDPASGAGQVGVYDVYPAVDINAAGQIGMTYSQSGIDTSGDFMSAYVTGRDPSDSLGTMEPAVLAQAGGGINFDGREGDTSGINVDPTNGSFWIATEYTDNINNWNEAIANYTVTPSPSNSTTVDLTAGNLSVSDNLGGIQNDLTVSEVTLAGTPYVQVFDAGNTLLATGGAIQIDNNTVDAPLSSVTTINVGPLDGTDTLTLDYSGGTLGGNGVTINYDGGAGGTNTLRLENGAFSNVIYTYNNDGLSGSIYLDGQFINFANTSSIRDTDTNTNDTFTLLATGAQASLQDDGVSVNNISEIVSLNATSVPTTFTNPSTLTVATSGGNSLVELGLMDAFFGPGVETFSGLPGDIFQVTDPGALAFATTVDLSTATLDLNGFSPSFDALNGDGTITDAAPGTFSTLTVGSNMGTGTFTGTIQDGNGNVSLTIATTGAVETLSGTNTYSGATTISAGTIRVGAANALSGNSDVTNNDTLDLNGFNATIGALNGGSTGIVTNTGAVLGTLTVGNTGNFGNFGGSIFDGSAAVGLTVNGGSFGAEMLSGFNTYSGPTTIITGTLFVGAENALSANSDVTVYGTLDLDGFDASIGSLGGNGTITNSGSNPATLTVGANGHSDIFNGLIDDGNAPIGLTVAGTGAVETLDGTMFYSGATTIDAGGTLVNGQADGLSRFSDVIDSGTLDLNGFDAIIGSLGGGSTGVVTNSGSTNVTLTIGGTGASGNFGGTITDGGKRHRCTHCERHGHPPDAEREQQLQRDHRDYQRYAPGRSNECSLRQFRCQRLRHT